MTVAANTRNLKVAQALQAALAWFQARDRMNAELNMADVHWSPLTEVVAAGLGAHSLSHPECYPQPAAAPPAERRGMAADLADLILKIVDEAKAAEGKDSPTGWTHIRETTLRGLAVALAERTSRC